MAASTGLRTHRMAPPPPNTSVAIIGGGAAGLVCGVKLRQLGVKNVTVFDTGKHAPGGRMSSRDIVVPAGPRNPRKHMLRVDHSAQLLSASTPRFQAILEGWTRQGLVAAYPQGAVGSLDATTGTFTPRQADLPPVYYPPQGMRSVAQHLAAGLDVQLPVWVGRVQRRDPTPGAPVLWDVYGERNRHLGSYNYLVIAHNGKCADRLMSTADAPSIHTLLRTQFRPQATPQQVMQMASLWMGVVVLPRSLRLPYNVAFVEQDPVLAYISNNSARIKANGAAEPLEAWTLFSTRQYAADNKVPQEAIPPAKEREVKAALLDAFARVTRTPRDALAPVYERVQLWGAAAPLNSTNTPCVLDVGTQAGICGDWLVAPSVEGAALSGEALAEHIVAHATGALTTSVGVVQVRFNPIRSAAIGEIRGIQQREPAPSTSQARQPGDRRPGGAGSGRSGGPVRGKAPAGSRLTGSNGAGNGRAEGAGSRQGRGPQQQQQQQQAASRGSSGGTTRQPAGAGSGLIRPVRPQSS